MMGSARSKEGRGGKRRGDTPLDRVLHALNHPIRRRILRTLMDGPGSASTLSRKLKMNLGITSYHLNKVLSDECEVLELTASIPRRGAIEKFHDLKFQALAKGERAGRGEADGGLRKMSLEECFIVAAAAADFGGFEELDGSAWEWFLARVDDEGWEEIREAGDEFNRRVGMAVNRSQEAVDEGAAHDVVVGVAAFSAVSPAPAS